MTTIKISGDDDIFWHLATGRYIIDKGEIPSSDVFGFATQGQKWIPFEWGWDILNFLLHKYLGYSGISIFRTLIFLVIFYLYFKISRKFNVRVSLMILIFILVVFGIFERLQPKPHTISYVFFAILNYIIIHYKYIDRKNHKILYVLPVIFLLWSNMHMGVLTGVAILGIFLISEMIIFIKPRKFSTKKIQPLRRTEIIILFLTTVISTFTLLINPNGVETYKYVYSHLNMQMVEEVFEWYSPFSKIYMQSKFFPFFIIFLIMSGVVMYYSIRKRDIYILLISIVFIAYSTRSVRFTIDFIIIISIYVIMAISYTLNELKMYESLGKFSIIFRSAVMVILMIFIYTSSVGSLYKLLDYPRELGFGIGDNNYPSGMFKFIKENDIQEIGDRPFNSYGCGGFFIWNFPNKKNFIDSRALSDEIYYSYKAINFKLNRFERKLEEFDFDYIIWFYPLLVNRSIEMYTSVVSYFINNSDKWKLVYWDDNSFLFVKNIEKFDRIISRFEYKFANPLYYIYQRDILKKAYIENKEDVFKEIIRNYRLNPEGNFINSMVKTFRVPVNQY